MDIPRKNNIFNEPGSGRITWLIGPHLPFLLPALVPLYPVPFENRSFFFPGRTKKREGSKNSDWFEFRLFRIMIHDVAFDYH